MLEINKTYNMDCLEGLKQLPDNSIHCCVTSPPYYNMRDYGIDGQIGLEATPEEYVQKLVDVFREVKRVLKPSGTLWLNIGDCYAGSGGPGSSVDRISKKGLKIIEQYNRRKGFGKIKPKDLIGIPWMVAFALRDDGWYLRSDIIWHKPNPLPESVKDRPTKSHEYIFLLSKSRKYYYDYEAMQEPATGYDGRRDIMMKGSKKYANADFVANADIQTIQSRGHVRWRFKTKSTIGNIDGQLNGLHSGNVYEVRTDDEMMPIRNKRSVWTVPTKPFKEAHFATFPPDLIEPCILAGCPVSGIVLDPFMGAGTTALVAIQNQRNFVGFELNPEYVKIAEKRIQNAQIKIVPISPTYKGKS